MQGTKGQVKMGIQTKFDGKYLAPPNGNTLPKMGGNLKIIFEKK
jgi:hypothetical protein